MPPQDEELLKVINTEDSLTLEELHELKRLAVWSKTARWIVAGIIGTVSLLGLGPHVIDWLVKTSSNG